MISTRPFLNTPTHEYVVPRSMPMLVFGGGKRGGVGGVEAT
jgi:hypothetical protein